MEYFIENMSVSIVIDVSFFTVASGSLALCLAVKGLNLAQIFVQHYMSQPARMAELSQLLAAGGRYIL